MIDFSHLESYRENNRIEAKKSLGGFPQSFWETYSAFANTLGGIILLGVVEHKDHSLHAVDLPDPDRLTKELWDTLNNPTKVSVNILTGKHVAVESVDGKRIIAVTVPRAQRYDKPVYIGGSAQGGTYRRNGEGDYRCTAEEIEAMQRDASVRTPDMRVLTRCSTDSLNADSVLRFRERMRQCRPKHIWESLTDEKFLLNIGATGRGEDSLLHPTAAGLLMFGEYSEILKFYPEYDVSYVDEGGEKCNWCGNISDFFTFACAKLTQSITVPLSAAKGGIVDVEPVSGALREALANCLINADYYGHGGIEIVRGQDKITFTNAGSFRVDLERAKVGGVSDPRNGALTKMFGLVDVGTGLGRGLPAIYAVWEKCGWLTPTVTESFNPDSITLTLSLATTDEGKPLPETGAELLTQRAVIIDYLTDHASATAEKLRRLINSTADRAEELLSSLIAADIIVGDIDGVYRLKR